MRNSITLNAAIAAVLSQKFVGGESAQIVQRDPESYPAPVSNSTERSYSLPRAPQHFDSLDRKSQHNRKRKKIANASRKRNRK